MLWPWPTRPVIAWTIPASWTASDGSSTGSRSGTTSWKTRMISARIGLDPRDRLIQNLQRRVIPGLDGIRGIAALSVVMFHGVSGRFPGAHAVNMFFVLSGMLITWLLLSE